MRGNVSFSIFTHEFRPGKLSEELKTVGEILNTTIEKQELWVKTDYGDFEGKVGDYYPQIDLLVLTKEATDKKNVLKPTDKAFDTFFESTTNPTNENTKSGSGFLDDIFDHIIPNHHAVVTMNLTEIAVNQGVNDYIKGIMGKNSIIAPYEFNNKLHNHFYKVLTSAKYHIRLYSLYAEPMDDSGYAASQSKLRYDEVIKLFSYYLGFFSDKDHFKNTKNFAIDTPHYVIYFHVDRDGDFSHELRQINKYLYNDSSKDILPFYDSENKMAEIPYENWAKILNSKPVLMFGWEEGMIQNKDEENKVENIKVEFNSFLGEYNVTGTDSQGNYLLSLADLRFDFPI